ELQTLGRDADDALLRLLGFLRFGDDVPQPFEQQPEQIEQEQGDHDQDDDDDHQRRLGADQLDQRLDRGDDQGGSLLDDPVYGAGRRLDDGAAQGRDRAGQVIADEAAAARRAAGDGAQEIGGQRVHRAGEPTVGGVGEARGRADRRQQDAGGAVDQVAQALAQKLAELAEEL